MYTQRKRTEAMDAPTSGRSADPVQNKDARSSLRGVGYERGGAALRPDAAPIVQKKDTAPAEKGLFDKLDDQTVDAVFAELKGGAEWKGVVEYYADATNWGYVPLVGKERDEVIKTLSAFIQTKYKAKAPEKKLAELLKQPGLCDRFLRLIEVAVLTKAPTAVFGILTEGVTLKTKKGAEKALPALRVVKMVSASGTTLTVEGYQGNEPCTGTVDKKIFRRQPGLTTYDHDDKSTTKEVPREYSYGDFSPTKGKETTSDGKDPKGGDVAQGAIGDCYLMAGLGAVAAQRPDLIKKMIAYDDKTDIYTVTFKDKQSDGSFKDHKVKVDGFLPTKNKSNPIYAQDAAGKGGKDQALWPAIIEKAFAAWKGDYQEIVGGYSSRAMELATGTKSKSESIPSKDEDVIKAFKGYQKDKKAVCAGTIDDVKTKSESAFKLSGGGYEATLKGSGTSTANLVKKSVTVHDTKYKAGSAKDDGDGKMTGSYVKSGSVVYTAGQVKLVYQDKKSPEKAEHLTANYRYRRLISQSLTLYGNHAYIFSHVDGNKLQFTNPWGVKNPKPMTAAEFRKFFGSLSVNTPPPPETA